MKAARRPVTLYVDTSVIGGYFDAEFMGATHEIWRWNEVGQAKFYVSDLVADELVEAPAHVRALMTTMFPPATILARTSESEALARAYVLQQIVSPKYANDARHVAICTLASLDFLVSWNFRHLANSVRAAGFNAVNRLHGHPAVHIVTPTFLIDAEKAD